VPCAKGNSRTHRTLDSAVDFGPGEAVSHLSSGTATSTFFNYYISSEKFRTFYEKTGCLYMHKYPWYPRSRTIHKVLAHGYKINSLTLVLLGCFGESASEARNKIYKKDRLPHARKNSRINTITDLFHKAIDSSDPLLSSVCLNR